MYDDYAVLIITSEKYGIFRFIIDIEDYEKVKQYWWSLWRIERCKGKNINIYAFAQKPKLMLHRFVMNVTDKNMVVDHIDGNTLDTRKCNLRECSNLHNMQNRKKSVANKSGCTGVIWDKSSDRWMAYIYYEKHQKTLGYYKTKEEAIKKRKSVEKNAFGDYLRENQ